MWRPLTSPSSYCSKQIPIEHQRREYITKVYTYIRTYVYVIGETEARLVYIQEGYSLPFRLAVVSYQAADYHITPSIHFSDADVSCI